VGFVVGLGYYGLRQIELWVKVDQQHSLLEVRVEVSKHMRGDRCFAYTTLHV
jgi:hypothetical protein